MQRSDDIFKLLKEEGVEAARKMRRGLIVQPGAIGDCILTLPLVGFMKDNLGLGAVDILGHVEYVGILPGRSRADGIRSIDSVDLHRLFVESKTFDLPDGDPLINAFSDYAWIVTFLGEPNGNFEQNLIFTANCSHSAAVATLSMKPPEEFSGHISDFHIEQFAAESGMSLEPRRTKHDDILIRATEADAELGRELLEEGGVGFAQETTVIQPGSGGLEKCWHMDNFLALAEELGRHGMEIVFLLGPAESDRYSKETLERIAASARVVTDLSLTQVLGLLTCVDSFVGNDSGITHLAAALGTKTIAVFGPTNPGMYGPIGPSVRVLTSPETGFTTELSAELQQQIREALTYDGNSRARKDGV
ncbi:MAG: glycosyltransferase family 9 protein [Planctomycetota bacterium]